jgi:arabinogalactan oligomer / maltooligosaccharide transport system substrate-binding protein
MKNWIWLAALFLPVLFVLEACTPRYSNTVVLWHYWQGEDAKVLNGMIDRFADLYDIRVIAQYVPIDEMEDSFKREASLGFGPDILLAPNNLMVPLAVDKRLADIAPLLSNEQMSSYKLFVLQMLRSRTENKLYGLPITTDCYALYYNTNLVSKPVKTIEDFKREATLGKRIAIRTSFFGAAWGVGAFGGEIQSDDGQIMLGQKPFQNWLSWLQSAQDFSFITFNAEKQPLIDSFKAGEAAYYIGDSRDLFDIRAALGEAVAVTKLPNGPGGEATPYLEAETLFFNHSSSSQQLKQALDFGLFLGAAEQQRRLMRDLGRLPANAQVRIDGTLEPTIGGFALQSESAVPFRGEASTRDLVFGSGREIYEQVLEGVLSPYVASQRLGQLNQKFGYDIPARE